MIHLQNINLKIFYSKITMKRNFLNRIFQIIIQEQFKTKNNLNKIKKAIMLKLQ